MEIIDNREFIKVIKKLNQEDLNNLIEYAIKLKKEELESV